MIIVIVNIWSIIYNFEIWINNNKKKKTNCFGILKFYDALWVEREFLEVLEKKTKLKDEIILHRCLSFFPFSLPSGRARKGRPFTVRVFPPFILHIFLNFPATFPATPNSVSLFFFTLQLSRVLWFIAAWSFPSSIFSLVFFDVFVSTVKLNSRVSWDLGFSKWFEMLNFVLCSCSYVLPMFCRADELVRYLVSERLVVMLILGWFV